MQVACMTLDQMAEPVAFAAPEFREHITPSRQLSVTEVSGEVGG